MIKRKREQGNKKKKGNSQSKEQKEAKKERKFPAKENKRNMHKGLWTRQHLNNTELSPSKQKKKGNHDLKWSSPFDCQPKSCASMTCSPHTKQKQKKEKAKNTQSQISHQKNPIPKKKSY